MKVEAVVAALAGLAAIPTLVPGQEAKPAGVERSVVTKAAREMMVKVRYCTMVTLGLDGHPQARIVDAFAPEADMSVWIATKPVTRKVREIGKDPRVTLLYFDHADPGYVTLLGTAEIVGDAEEKAKRWKEDWAAFYKDRNHGDDYVLIRVRPRRLEIVSYGHGLLNDPETWRPISVEFE
jgi:general stress protein 26